MHILICQQCCCLMCIGLSLDQVIVNCGLSIHVRMGLCVYCRVCPLWEFTCRVPVTPGWYTACSGRPQCRHYYRPYYNIIIFRVVTETALLAPRHECVWAISSCSRTSSRSQMVNHSCLQLGRQCNWWQDRGAADHNSSANINFMCSIIECETVSPGQVVARVHKLSIRWVWAI
jgi:hypothetical protein